MNFIKKIRENFSYDLKLSNSLQLSGKRDKLYEFYLFCKVMWYIVLLMVVIDFGMFIANVYSPGCTLPTRIPLVISLDKNPVFIYKNNQKYPSELYELSGTLVVNHTNSELVILTYVQKIPIILIVLFGFFQLKRISDELKKGEPFALQNYKRIKFIGYSVVAFFIYDLLSQLLNNYLYYDYIKIPNTNMVYNFEPKGIYLFFAGLIFALAEIFKHGSQLKQENDLTI